MSCCVPPPVFAEAIAGPQRVGPAADEILLSSREVDKGVRQTDLSVPSIHCGACVQAIEKAFGALDRVESARVNLSTKRVAVRWKGEAPPPLFATLARLGYEAHLYETGDDGKDPALGALVRALAVAAFASMNIMMLSGSVWSGADAATRDVLHWICAGLTLPTLLYSGRVFYVSAWKALRHGRANMDVPITVGVFLAFALSVYDTIHSGTEVYYDATVSLLFFLLIGRTLDHVMRERARTAVKGLARLAPRGALVEQADGTREYLPLREIGPGMRILLAAGERVPVDATILSGSSDVDRSLVTGESAPAPMEAGARLEAGTLNLTGPLTIRAEAGERESTLAELLRLMEAASGGRSRYRRIADRVAGVYAPVVHLAALVTFLGWMAVNGDVHNAVTIAIAVLIITCPCALGLAVPMVQVVAARRLFDVGIMVKDGSALERLAEIDCVVFDKTGTLTTGQPQLANAEAISAETLALAGGLAVHSRHPHARSIALATGDTIAVAFTNMREVPGAGIEGVLNGAQYRLGRADWALTRPAGTTGTVFARDGDLLAHFDIRDALRAGAREAIQVLMAGDMPLEIVSGDEAVSVDAVGDALGIANRSAGVMPGGKSARLAALSASGRRPLMVGDGLNDAPALAAAYVSMAPGSAADIGRNAADLVFLRDNLDAVPQAIAIAREASRLVRQNLVLALVYNAVALPVATIGLINPFLAAVAMSASSVVVVLNALRLGWSFPGRSSHTALLPAEATA
ncbi:heavy metal translocating P-type ATPase [Devosia nitrariae]|uniref:Copper-translocating P-type ATPase n=1 Tax=Devosia nitrariae TaxID=2071872 RepID=A0ABQ5W919_9HYPH|nr:heavy metal translocating P-type ATPase [Devosia nitrariae]GLQ56604.1 copper-translocating P-type ATPase [Devosia nitrariae]